jgi:hypothetical protein
MTVLAVDIERPAILGGDLECGSLDELIVRAWSAVRAGRAVPCPVCRGRMAPERAGRCRDCGSALS